MKNWMVEVGVAVWSSVCVRNVYVLAIFPHSSISMINVTAPMALKRPIKKSSNNRNNYMTSYSWRFLPA